MSSMHCWKGPKRWLHGLAAHALQCLPCAGDVGQALDVRKPCRSFDMAFESLLATSVSTLMAAVLPRDPPEKNSQRMLDMLPV